MQQFIKEVGRGKKGAKDLSYEKAQLAAQLIVNEGASDAQLGAFLIAERIKEETPEELLAFIRTYREHATLLRHSHKIVLDTAGPYDGRSKTFMSTFAASLVVAAAGGRVVMHGSPTLPPKLGTTIGDVLHELGLPHTVTAESAERLLNEVGICALQTEQFCPPLRKLRAVREQIGVRTLFNTVEKALNLGNATHAILGVFHESALDKAIELQKQLSFERSAVVQGVEGSEDVPVYRRFKICIIDNGHATEQVIDPKAYSLSGAAGSVSLTPYEQASHTRMVLSGNESPFYPNVLLNSALKLWVCGLSPNLDHGLAKAEQIISSGQALHVLERWQSQVIES